MTESLAEEYERLVNQAASLLGGKRAVSRWLGRDKDTLRHRLDHPDGITRENVAALECLIAKVLYKHKYAIGGEIVCKCGGVFEHSYYKEEFGSSIVWQFMKCSKCKKIAAIQCEKNSKE